MNGNLNCSARLCCFVSPQISGPNHTPHRFWPCIRCPNCKLPW